LIIKLKYFFTLLIISSSLANCQQFEIVETTFKLGADVLIDEHLDFLYDKKVGLVVNHTSLLSNGTHILDTLLSLNINITVIFSPEHGFYGNLERGKMISDSKIRDIKLYSLHGKEKKPAKEMLENLDLIIYDIQDIGVRFYTYVSTLYYVLESAVENNIPMIVLDRPNPNGGLKIAGPVLKNNFKSFLGLTEIPIVYGLTTGELAKFYFKELILNSNSSYDFKVFKMKFWNRNMSWNETGIEWIAPSPNITCLQTAIVYPGTCLLEGTNVSEGRGTKEPFLQIGAPFVRGEDLSIEMNEFIDDSFEIYPVSFTPKSIKGKAENPKYENELCNGISINVKDEMKFDAVSFGVNLIYALYKLYPDQFEFNSAHFDLLAGTDQIRKLTLNDNTPDFIINSWQEELNKFKSIREKYLLY
jgi:beta-N-acetylhexosaminidase